ncbi:MAG TPA: UDP-N-acetylglucosamine--N-acetylmuramyl-(pentapeptide) pyrophosphoryl-undecaprenol N-acetylglucosamine transferase [bacterium]|nr:UDP-N-acetylglucosamine--N-acetylmuramyl-(pentapeptide) pyrophosphoryl-undecaprenol N-acetylglucosamine transferase [bacterium]HOL35414.1 UDP-N-acetylglucosamine--N-acetylmuramyl-(pentapeptide) pyrophosphoryl-undecaprenol N-acetylglucosamine transferase [bacterium]HPP08807.1 UDP-N-acetylglucosamine--N-acetylmuramyl-(pentapeptide) pyrophosphoryl-undecaprenol N-acetylglucosamine transferase [bacterium]
MGTTKKILIVVGSTGGHYFPGITLGEKLREIEPSVSVIFAGEKKIKNLEIWKMKDFQFITIPILKRPSRWFLLIFAPFIAIFVLIRSFILLSRVNPDLVVCMGSYVTVFVGIASVLSRRNVVLHEQNLVPGLANRILNYFGVTAAITFEDTKKFLKKCIRTGFPLRPEFLYSRGNPVDYNLSSGKRTILVFGGSQGASFINNLFLEAIQFLNWNEFQVIHITGRIDLEKVKDIYCRKRIPGYVTDFSYDMPCLMDIADIGITRAGAGTIAEISFKGIPSIIIPYRFGGGHQRYNAEWAAKNGCIMLEEPEATSKNLVEILRKIHEEIDTRKKQFQSACIADVNGVFARYCLNRIEKHGKNN